MTLIQSDKTILTEDVDALTWFRNKLARAKANKQDTGKLEAQIAILEAHVLERSIDAARESKFNV